MRHLVVPPFLIQPGSGVGDEIHFSKVPGVGYVIPGAGNDQFERFLVLALRFKFFLCCCLADFPWVEFPERGERCGFVEFDGELLIYIPFPSLPFPSLPLVWRGRRVVDA